MTWFKSKKRATHQYYINHNPKYFNDEEAEDYFNPPDSPLIPESEHPYSEVNVGGMPIPGKNTPAKFKI